MVTTHRRLLKAVRLVCKNSEICYTCGIRLFQNSGRVHITLIITLIKGRARSEATNLFCSFSFLLFIVRLSSGDNMSNPSDLRNTKI
jgi:hypothetical protein